MTTDNRHEILTGLETACWARLQAMLPDFALDGSAYRIVIEAMSVLEKCGAVRQEFMLWPDDETKEPAAADVGPAASLGRNPEPCDVDEPTDSHPEVEELVF